MLHVGTRAHGEFGGVRAEAYPAWREEHPTETTKSELENQGYYYAWGGSGRLFADLELPRFAVGVYGRYGKYNSREGLDRAQETITFDVNAIDRALEASAWMRFFSLTQSGFFVEASLTEQRRWSNVGGEHATTRLRRVSLELGFRR
jgi:hypothetical protein